MDYQRVGADAPTLVATAHAAGKKAILGVVQPYWLGQTASYRQSISANRAGLIDNIMRNVDAYGYDGVDLDWEPFNPATDGPAMNAFAADLKSRLGARTLTVAATVSEYKYWGTAHTPFDRVNVMTYDMTGTAAKIACAKKSGLGGCIIWNLGGDYLPGQNPKHPLLTAVKNAMLTP